MTGMHKKQFYISSALGLGIAALAMLPIMTLPSQAAPLYSLSHNSDAFGNTGPTDTIGPQGTPISYSFNGLTYITGANVGTVEANVGQGSMGIFGVAANDGRFAIQRQEVFTGFTFDVIFGSAGNDSINVALNLMLDGLIELGNAGSKTIEVFAGPNGAIQTGDYIKYATDPFLTRIGLLSGFSDDGTEHSITTNVFSVPVNVPVNMMLGLRTGQTYSTIPGSISFGSTFSLSTIGDVFTIVGADGIDVNSVDAGIVNNRFGATAVPAPATLPIFLVGLIGLGVTLRSLRRNNTC